MSLRGPLRVGALLLALTAALMGVVHLVGTPDEQGLVPLTGAPYAPGVAVAQGSQTAPGVPAARGADRPAVDEAWVRRTAARSGIPETAVRAYATASLRAPRRCGLGWTTLAAIGWIESHHGTLGNRVLRLDGTSSTPVLGPALDGEGGFRAIPATAAGTALHGDPRWDHAVGPMQFITDTWQRWGADGDRDGRVDPQDLDDAALAAARYLCADGRDLTSGAGWSGGIFSYNRSQSYLQGVYDTASTYADRVAG
jgi:membrane-bound lytic murein transglycosylase B